MEVLALLFPSVHFLCFTNGYWLCSESRKNDWRICQSSIQIALSRSIFELGSWFKSKMEVLALLFPSVHFLCFTNGYWLCSESRKNDWRICQSSIQIALSRSIFELGSWFKSKMEVLALLFPSVHVLCFLAGYWLCSESRKNDWRICQSFSSTCSTQPVYRVATNSSISVNI